MMKIKDLFIDDDLDDCNEVQIELYSDFSDGYNTAMTGIVYKPEDLQILARFTKDDKKLEKFLREKIRETEGYIAKSNDY